MNSTDETQAASRTSLWSSLNISVRLGINFEVIISFGRIPESLAMTSATCILTFGRESLEICYKWGTTIINFSEDTFLMNFYKLSILATLTSFSPSLRRFVKI